MTIKERLDLIALSKDFKITPTSAGYLVKCADYDLEAYIDSAGFCISYHITGVMNSAFDSHEIDMDELMKLKEYCEMLVKKG